jgi:hypothetical protein
MRLNICAEGNHMNFVRTCRVFLRSTLLLAALGCMAREAAGQAHLLFTADTQGHVGPCQSCPGAHGLGSLARRQTLVLELRRREPGLLLLDAGDALFGDESVPSGGKVVAATYDALGYDAVNIGYRDFRLGKAATLAALQGAKFAPLSANLLDDASGQPLFRPYVVKSAGAERIAIVGVTESPAALEMLPELKRQLAGVRIAPPAKALAAALPKARAEAGHVIVLFYGSAAGVGPIRKQFGASVDAILMGGAAPGELPETSVPAIVGAASHGREVVEVSLAAGRPPQVTRWPVTGSIAPDAALQKVIAAYPTGSEPLTLSSGPATGAATQSAIDRIEPGKTERLDAAGRNRAVELRVKSVALLDALGDAAAPAGTRLLVIDAELRNLQPAQRVNGQMVPAQYQVPKLADNLYAVADDSLVLARAPIDAAGLLPFGPVSLKAQNDTAAGRIAYAVPRDAVPREVTLRFYDFAHGNIVVPVLAGHVDPPKQVAPPQHNQVIEAAIYGITKTPDLNGRAAPAGKAFLLVDLRARSTMVNRVSASAFDTRAAAGATVDVGTVADWKDTRKYIQVVADGQYAYWPLPQSGLPEAPRFLPDVMTGGQVAFAVPVASRSLELRCDFPNAALPDGKQVRPEGLTFELEGASVPPTGGTAIAQAQDGIFDVAIMGQQATDAFGGAKADEGRRFVVLDVRVRNLNKQQEFFQPREQLKFVTAAGEQVEYDEAASLAGMHPPAQQMYIPAGAQRRFELAYGVGADEARPRVAYAAVTEGASKVLTLPVLSPQIATATPSAAVPSAPGNPPPATPAASDSPPAQPPAPRAPAPPPAPAPAATAMKPTAATSAAPDAPAIPGATPPIAAPAAPAPAQAVTAPAPAPTPAPAPAPPEAAEAGPIPRPHGPAKGIEGVGLTAEQVNAAIDRGSKALWEFCNKKDTDEGVPFGDRGEDVLCALALVHADAPKKIPAFDAALRAYLTRVDPANLPGSNPTYVNGLLCMLIQAYGDPTFEPKLRLATRWLMETQGSDGTWTYSDELPKGLFAAAPNPGALQVSGGLPPGAKTEPLKRQMPWPKDPLNGDNSCTQYALLGLQSSASSGIILPAELWSRAMKTAKERQGTDSGGWDYHGTSSIGGYGSMTAAGVCAVAICAYQTGQANFANDPAVVHGLGWMDKYFAVNSHPGYGEGKEWAFYWLYSVERVGRMLDTDFIGAHEWYPEGAAWLVGSQGAEGLWQGQQGDEKNDLRLPTSFALLFLTRATPPLKPVQRVGPGMLKTTAAAPDNWFYVILDASGSMLDNMDGRVKFDIARDSVRSMIDALPPNSEVALRVYGHRKSALDPDCDEDTELKIPMGPLDKQAFNAALSTLRPRGKTPMALSIQDAIQDLGTVGADKPVTLLLLTDGGEDTRNPRGNPVKACAELAKVKNVRFHIVGFDINEPIWSQQLQDMAQVSGGRYWPAAHGADLARSVRNAVLGIPDQFAVLDANGHAVHSGRFGDSVPLGEGKYLLRTAYAGRAFEQPFYVSPGETTAVTFDASQVPAAASGEAAAPAPPAAAAPTAAAAPPAAPAAPPAAPAAPPTVANWPKFCTHCGAPLKPGQKFCSKCGTPVVVK